METILSIIAIILSGISVLAFVVLTIKTISQNNKINNINMNARLYDRIFDDFLINRIPKERTYLRFDEENKLVDSEGFCEALTDLKQSLLYFRYAQNEFYKCICKKIDELEEYIMKKGNERSVQEEQGAVFNKIQEYLEDIYETIYSRYIGK